MSSKLMVNLIDPNDIIVPDTGVFSVGQNTAQTANILIVAIIALAFLAVLTGAIVFLIKRHKKQKLLHEFSHDSADYYKTMKLNTKKRLFFRMAGLAVFVLACVLGFLNFQSSSPIDVEALGDGGNELTIVTDDTAIDIEVTDKSVFGLSENKVAVTSPTEAGYTLMAYVDSETTDLINESELSSESRIKMLETSYSQPLTDNTWGMALTRPDDQEDVLFRGLPTNAKDAMVLKVSSDGATEAGEEATFYYGAYVTPDLDYGTYAGVTINYVAVAHVVEEDVTVVYHGEGYYFDEDGTRETNVVKYGKSCEIAYIGGNCRRVYSTEQPYEIVKTPNLDNDGTQDGAYPVSVWNQETGQNELTINQTVSIPGADGIRVEFDYGLTASNNSAYVYALRGQYDWNSPDSIWPDEYEELYLYSNSVGSEVYEFDGNTITFIVEAWQEPEEGYDYGVYARVYPIYNNKPEDIETIEGTVCYFAKSKNLDDDGNKIRPYYYDESDDEWYYQTITLPGAKKVKVVIEYAITDRADIEVVEGYWDGPWNYWGEIYTEGDNLAGESEYIIDGSTVTVDMAFWDDPVEGYDYGFYARLYPIYDEEQDDTMPTEVCSLVRKEGEYSVPVGFSDNHYWTTWYNIIDDNGYLYRGTEFHDENNVMSLIKQDYESLTGKTIDVYLYNKYYIGYNSNGGSGYVSSQSIYPHTNSESIRSNNYTRQDYSFIGWNTSPDGDGTWYYPYDVIYDLLQPGESMTLYAQWEHN